MPLYVVSYDLKVGGDYEPLTNRLEELHAVRALESFWLVDLADNGTVDVRDHLQQFLPSTNDKLMVVKFVERPRFTRAFTAAVSWIQHRFG